MNSYVTKLFPCFLSEIQSDFCVLQTKYRQKKYRKIFLEKLGATDISGTGEFSTSYKVVMPL